MTIFTFNSTIHNLTFTYFYPRLIYVSKSLLIADLAECSPAGLKAALRLRVSMRERKEPIDVVGYTGLLRGCWMNGLSCKLGEEYFNFLLAPCLVLTSQSSIVVFTIIVVIGYCSLNFDNHFYPFFHSTLAICRIKLSLLSLLIPYHTISQPVVVPSVDQTDHMMYTEYGKGGFSTTGKKTIARCYWPQMKNGLRILKNRGQGPG